MHDTGLAMTNEGFKNTGRVRKQAHEMTVASPDLLTPVHIQTPTLVRRGVRVDSVLGRAVVRANGVPYVQRYSLRYPETHGLVSSRLVETISRGNVTPSRT